MGPPPQLGHRSRKARPKSSSTCLKDLSMPQYSDGPRLLLLLALGCAGPGSRSYPDKGASDVVTSEAPSIQGTVTQKSPGRILIEEEPLDSSRSAKASVRLTSSTRVLRGGEPARTEDLREGQRVSVWFDGPVLQSYPVQATASAVRIEAEEGMGNLVEIDGIIRYHELEGGFYAIQSKDGETYNPTNLPEEFRQDGLPVRAKVRIREDMMGIHQAGPLVDIVEIRRR
jgi:Protein of unknown function (DUF3221)